MQDALKYVKYGKDTLNKYCNVMPYLAISSVNFVNINLDEKYSLKNYDNIPVCCALTIKNEMK